MQEAHRSIEPLKRLLRKHAIIWIMIKPEPLEDSSEPSKLFLESKIFFSTLEYGTIPITATDVFLPLVQQLQEEWDAVYGSAEQHLDYRVVMSSLIKYPSLLSNSAMVS